MVANNSRKKNMVFVSTIIMILFVLIFILNNNKSSKIIEVGIIEPMDHIAITDITNGIKSGLSKFDKINLLIQNAHGDATSIPQIISRYEDKDVDIYIPIFTQTTQTVKNVVKSKPIFFAAVTDPISAGIVKNVSHPESNITGVSDLWPIGAQFDIIQEILPNANRVGILFDPGDVSSRTTMPLIRKEVENRKLELIERPVYNTNDIAQSLNSLINKVDFIFTANDVTVTAALPAIVKFSIKQKIPFFAGDYSSVQRGAIAAVGQNYYNVGKEVANMIIKYKKGYKIQDLPISYTKGGDIYINKAAATDMKVIIPSNLLNKAKEIYTKY